MGTFTRLDGTELRELAAAFGLGRIREHRSIAAGTINSNYELHTEHGHYFARVNEGKSVGSSRVDLQACKLEYSIVSPK